MTQVLYIMQLFNHMLAIILLISLVSAGDIATLNCPSGFDINSANLTTAASLDLLRQASSLYGSYSTASNVARIQNIIISGNEADLSSYMRSQQIPYIIVGIAYLVGYVVLIICCAFDTTCPICPRLRRDFAKNPYGKGEIFCTMAFALATIVSIAAITIVAFSGLPSMKQAIVNTKCSLYVVLDTVLNGDSNTGWAGTTALNKQISNISALLNSTATSIGTYFVSNSWLVDDMTSQRNQNNNIYYKYTNSTLSSPNPNSSTPISSRFLSTFLGPSSSNVTMTYFIDQALSSTQILSKAAYALNQAAQELVDSISLIQTNIIYTINDFNFLNYQLANSQFDIDFYVNEYVYNDFATVVYILEGVVILLLVSCLVGAFGVFATSVLEIHSCRRMVHVSWMLLGFTFFGVLILTFVFVPMGDVGYQFCNLYSSSLTNQATFQRFKGYYSQNVLSKFETCLFGDANLLKPFHINDQMNTVIYLFTNLSNYQDLTNASSADYINTTTTNNVIASWIQQIANYRDGIYVDYDPYVTNDSNPNYALSSLNNYTLRAIISGQNCAKDQWQFNVVNCTINGNNYTHQSSSFVITADQIPPTSSICIPFNQALNTSQYTNGYPWTQQDFNQRYQVLQSYCPQTYSAVIKYGYSLINYRNSRFNTFQSLLTDLNTLYSLNTAYNLNLVQFASKVTSFSSSTTTINNLTTNLLTGISISANCSIVRDKLLFTYNSLCVNFLSQAVKLGTFLVILCFLTGLGTIAGCLFAVRFSRIQRQILISQPQPEHQLEQTDSDVKSQESD